MLAGEPCPLAGEVGGAGMALQAESLEHRDRVLQRDEAGDIGFAQVERLKHMGFDPPAAHRPGLSTSAIQSHM
jgi:hypothetical protein